MNKINIIVLACCFFCSQVVYGKSDYNKKLQEITIGQLRAILIELSIVSQAPEPCRAFARYQNARLLLEYASDEPLLYLPALKMTMIDLRQLRKTMAREYILALSTVLPPQKINIHCSCKQEVRAVSVVLPLDITSQYGVVKTLEQCMRENPTVELANKAELLRAMRLAVLESARAEAPGLIQDWGSNNGEWGSAARKLYTYLTEDAVPPSTLGLNKEQVLQLMELGNK